MIKVIFGTITVESLPEPFTGLSPVLLHYIYLPTVGGRIQFRPHTIINFGMDVA